MLQQFIIRYKLTKSDHCAITIHYYCIRNQFTQSPNQSRITLCLVLYLACNSQKATVATVLEIMRIYVTYTFQF